MAIVPWFAIVAPLLLALIALAVWFFIAAHRKSRRTGTGEPIVRLTYNIAAIWAMGSLIVAAIGALAALLGSQVQIAFPVAEFWPKLPDGLRIDGTSATLESGGFTRASGLVQDLSLPTRICWAVSQALSALVPGAVALFIAVACYQLLHGRAFSAVVARMALVAGVAVAAGGVAAQVIGDIAGSMAAGEVLQWSSAAWDNQTDPGASIDDWWPQAGLSIQFPFWPLAAGLGFAALAAIFRYGNKLQRDQEGLI